MPDEVKNDMNFKQAEFDVGSSARQVLSTLERDAARLLVRLEIASQEGLRLRSDKRRLEAMLRGMISDAIQRAPCGRVLVSAGRHGGRIYVSVVDDGEAVPGDVLAASLREAQRMVALQGGFLDHESQQGRGTMVRIRLLDPAQARHSGPIPLPLVAERAKAATISDRARGAVGEEVG
ncbi:MAG: HAMP domain-containing histidine kinase [Acetobacteraceae bacterium]|nr:HAMP domain-containing histidine kinase [Acetobacteraceae bacterium]MBV8589678.1 HAMP domain-containing histidine kinase [Acetobacteraceae bacterium]